MKLNKLKQISEDEAIKMFEKAWIKGKLYVRNNNELIISKSDFVILYNIEKKYFSIKNKITTSEHVVSCSAFVDQYMAKFAKSILDTSLSDVSNTDYKSYISKEVNAIINKFIKSIVNVMIESGDKTSSYIIRKYKYKIMYDESSNMIRIIGDNESMSYESGVVNTILHRLITIINLHYICKY